MAKKSSNGATQEARDQKNLDVETRPTEETLLEQVRLLLHEGNPQEALNLLNPVKWSSPAIANARAVCLVRLGHAKTALNLLRPLVVADLNLRPDAPVELKINFATALLLDGNVAGFLSTLKELNEEGHPAVQQLRAVFKKWRSQLPLWHKLQWYLGGEPTVPVKLDFLPGTL